MKVKGSLIGMMAALFVMPAMAATNFGASAASSADLSGMPAVRERTQVNYEKYETRTSQKTYDANDGRNMYYTQPANRSALYKQYAGADSNANVRTSRAETYRSELKRKYYLAHPFFQPTKGKFGSVTDLAYNMNSYDVSLVPLPTTDWMSDNAFAWDMGQFSIKEDLSFGFTDTVAILATARFDVSDYKADWKNPETPDDKMDDSDFSLLGLGAQWRFVDTADWIATASAYYQYQPDSSNNFVLDLKAGYKVSTSTIYGLVRGWYLNFDGNSYGNSIVGKNTDGVEDMAYLVYNDDAKNVFFVEGGLGVFSVLDEDWTLNVEAVFGNYDWHNQFSAKAAIGWQPNEWFALNLYGKMSLWDSADGDEFMFWQTNSRNNTFVPSATATIDNYSEASVGVQAIFMF